MPLVLIIEDNPINRDILGRRLERRGYSVRFAEDGPTGIEAATTIDAARSSPGSDVRRFLGVDVDLGRSLGLSADWAQRIIRQVGNYGDLFDRHFGQKSSLKLERRLNNLSSKGGLHYAPPFR